jgi:hypothetical protein
MRSLILTVVIAGVKRILLNTDVIQLPSGWDATFAKLEYLYVYTFLPLPRCVNKS